MKIGIDARLIHQTGVGIYTRNLLENLHDIAPENLEFYIYLQDKDIDSINFTKRNFLKRSANYRWHTFAEQLGFLNALNKDDLDLMHFTYFSYPLFYKKPFIITIHDLTPLLHATGKASTLNPIIYEIKKFAFSFLIDNAVKNAQTIITPTKTVKSQILDMYGKKISDKIAVTYEGLNQAYISTKPNNNLKEKFRQPFFIYVGNFYPHKNVERLIKAYAQAKIDIQLILIGPEDYFTKKIHQYIYEAECTDKIRLYHNAQAADLSFFYQNAQALIHPSIAEGFGLPLLEASYFSLPVIASDIPVINEVLGEDYLKFDPYDIDDIAKKIKSFNKATAKVAKINPEFSFKRMTVQTLHLYTQS